MQTRRKFITQSGAALATFTGVLGTSLTSNASTTAPKQSLFDFTNPEDTLATFVKLFGDLSEEPVLFSSQGRIYSSESGRMSIPLFNIEGIRWVRCKKEGEKYRIFMRDWAIYKDVITAEPLDLYQNPLTGKTNTTHQILTGLQDWVIGPNGVDLEDSRVAQSWLANKPLNQILPWRFENGEVTLSLEFMIQYASGAGGAEWMHLTASQKELLDKTVTSTATRLAWNGDSPWIRWMEMGDRPGRTSWQSTGYKYNKLEDLRPELLTAINRYFPGSLEQPETYEKVSLTTSPQSAE